MIPEALLNLRCRESDKGLARIPHTPSTAHLDEFFFGTSMPLPMRMPAN